MNELDRIREQIKRMRCKSIEPETVWVCYDLWDKLNRIGKIAGVCVCPKNDSIGRFEVR